MSAPPPIEPDVIAASSGIAGVPAVPGVLEPDSPPQDELAIAEVDAQLDAGAAIRSGKLAGKGMWAAIWILALPVLIESSMAACVGLVDTILAGRLPGEIVVPALDGIGIGSYVLWFTGIAMTGLGIGGQAIIARGIGAGNHEQSHTALGHAMLLSVVWGAIVGLVLWMTVYPLAWFCKLAPEAADYLALYVRAIAIAMPLTGIMMVGTMCLHGAGETMRPAIISVAVSVLNIVFSWILSGVDLSFNGAILINPFPFDWGVVGIAAGTAIAYAIGAVMTLVVMMRGVKDLRLERRHLRVQRCMTSRIIRVGVPGFFESFMMWGANLFVLLFIGSIAERLAQGGVPATGLQGAHVIAVRWESISFLPGFAMGIAAGALAGQYLGAGNPRMAQRAITACTGVAAAIMGAMGVLFMTQGEFLTRIVSAEPVHLREAPALLFICGLVQVFFAVTMVARQGLRGAGDTRWTFIITTVSCWGVRLPAAWFFGVHLEMGLTGIWIGLCGELVVRGILFAARFLHGGWTSVQV